MARVAMSARNLHMSHSVGFDASHIQKGYMRIFYAALVSMGDCIIDRGRGVSSVITDVVY
jgi:hypothetical protein